MTSYFQGGAIDSYVRKYQRLITLAIAFLFVLAQFSFLLQPVKADHDGQNGDAQKVSFFCSLKPGGDPNKQEDYYGVKFDPPQDGTIDGITATFSIDENDNETVTVTTEADKNITKVVVKGGSEGDDNHGNRIHEGLQQWSDLTAPLNESSTPEDDTHEISHVIVCYTEADQTSYCDPSQKPGGMSIDEWVPKDVNCVVPQVQLECGSFDGLVSSEVQAPWGDNYSIVWSEGSPDYSQFTPLPASFPEDYNGGSVTVYWWIVGPEAGYVQGHELPNYWDENAASVEVNTDCEEPETATVIAHKIICEDEALLPNGINTSIGEGFAEEWVEENDGCELVEDWSFEWSTEGIIGPDDNPANDHIGTAGSPWNTFTAEVNIPIDDIASVDKHGNKIIELREVLQEGYIPFTGLGGSDVSAEFYCHDDVNGFDNIEWIKNPEDGDTYYCVAWNAEVEDDNGGDDDKPGDEDEKDEEEDEQPVVPDEDGQVLGDDSDDEKNEGEVLAVTGNNIWLGTLLGTLIVALSITLSYRPLLQTVTSRFKK